MWYFIIGIVVLIGIIAVALVLAANNYDPDFPCECNDRADDGKEWPNNSPEINCF